MCSSNSRFCNFLSISSCSHLFCLFFFWSLSLSLSLSFSLSVFLCLSLSPCPSLCLSLFHLLSQWCGELDNQAADRAFRIGQKRDVIIYRLLTCGTIEESMFRRQI